MIIENPKRHVAMTNGSASDRRISGAANEIPTTDSANTSSGDVCGAAAGDVEGEVITSKLLIV
jgi:hypothetical protein